MATTKPRRIYLAFFNLPDYVPPMGDRIALGLGQHVLAMFVSNFTTGHYYRGRGRLCFWVGAMPLSV